MEYSPPPLFKQGASARAKMIFFSLLSVALLFADSKYHSLDFARQVVNTALYPLQTAALAPRDMIYRVGDYFASVSALEQQNRGLQQQQLKNAETLQQSQQLLAENAQLRKLLGAAERLPSKYLMSEILYDTRDPFTRKIELDRGSQQGVTRGQPVIDDVGVVGQVTHVSLYTSEVTLLTDKDQAIAVQDVRSGLRSVAYGRGQSGGLDLRFMATNADIQKGDLLVTSGMDGVFPPGLAVARVMQVEAKSNDAFAHITCQPAAGVDRNRQLLILLVDARPPREEFEDKDKKEGKPGRRASVATPGAVSDPGAAPAPATPVTAPTAVAPAKPADNKGADKADKKPAAAGTKDAR
ncbi:MAG: rod shape-determining protein MreC [Burkholderiaceae bacterium]|nr:rod shape-determining protein MreC [Burkholderiaceae bacterium]